MTNDELINVTCKWLDYNHSKYAMQHTNKSLYVAGACQTDLRAYLNSVKDRDYNMVMNELYIEHHKK